MSHSFKTIVDVRTVEEYREGHAAGSINIPLHELTGRLDEIKAMEQPLLLCCAKGIRSGQAAAYLHQLGIDCANGGSWQAVQDYISKQ
ncbi:rhodanese-like domain-containing protein [Edaphocola aurantiacus]|jgi:rhodanese-related sulfurtransferase|uniref:rhodanese-like domain-containing protein n=1 Tax=Edaphocola aurantiacus TaxID=2601682 RepID=UPI001C9792AE|nr:rhodanese-like domain-containing protein [Edaphocola aurantiacus]